MTPGSFSDSPGTGVAFKTAALLALLLGLPLAPVQACGWWGDGEMGKLREAEVVMPGGKPAPQELNLETTKLPGTIGYGFAVPDPGQAVPYLQATHGRPVTRIGEFKAYGFGTVVDLATPAAIARLHRVETESAGMVYVSIPLAGDVPDDRQAERFRQAVLGSSAEPLLVYAPRAEVLGVMWASYRLGIGAPVSYALAEGRALGMLPEQEAALLALGTSRAP